MVAIEMFGKYRVVDAAINSRNLIQRFKTTVNIEFSDFVAVFEALGDEARSLHAAVESEGSQSTSAGYRSHRRRRQAPIVGTGSGPTRRPHAPSNGPGAPGRYATRATAPSSPHIPQPLCRQDRPRMQRLPTTAPSIRPIRTQSTPSDRFLVNPPSTARFADLRQNDRQRRSHQALTAGAEREDAPSRTAHLTHRAVPRRAGPAVLTHQQPQPPSCTLPVMILTATSPSTDGVILLDHYDIVTGEAIVASNVL